MPDHRGSVREIAWQEVFPWLLLVRSFRVAVQVWQLMLGAVGVLATVFGWWLLALVFGGTEEAPLKNWIGSYKSCPWSAMVVDTPRGELVVVPQRSAAETLAPVGEAWRGSPPTLGRYPANPFIGPWQQLRAPFQSLFRGDLGITGLAFLCWPVCGRPPSGPSSAARLLAGPLCSWAAKKTSACARPWATPSASGKAISQRPCCRCWACSWPPARSGCSGG